MDKTWTILSKDTDIINTLLKNRGLETKKQKEEFFNPINPNNFSLETLGIDKLEISKVIQRLKIAKKNKEHIIIYGDYDADGICATAILWEVLHKEGYDTLPYIPERFSEGYGINASSIEKLKSQNSNLKLIITVDNGIVAYDAIKKAKQLGVDVVVVDHHQTGNKKLTTDYIIHSDKVCGVALSYLFSKEIKKEESSLLELTAIGTIADQMPLTGINRSFARFGLEALNNTRRLGLRAILREARIEKVGVYEVGFIIAPRLNATGRLTHAIDSLRLLCTRDFYKANDLSQELGRVNKKRQKIVQDVIYSVEKKAQKNENKIIVVAGKDYNEGVIGLAAGKITEKYFRPSIVLSVKGGVAKASARSIPGFNIIKAIKATKLIIEGGGHPMAAGFSIDVKNIEKFRKEINKIADKKLTKDILTKSLKIDIELEFNQLNQNLMDEIRKFEPFGLGNPAPVFLTKKVKVLESKKVGRDGKHLKLKLEKDGIVIGAIWFNSSTVHSSQFTDHVSIVYNLEENTFNGTTTLQLKVKDLKDR